MLKNESQLSLTLLIAQIFFQKNKTKVERNGTQIPAKLLNNNCLSRSKRASLFIHIKAKM